MNRLEPSDQKAQSTNLFTYAEKRPGQHDREGRTMQKTRKVREIYAELKSACGEVMSSRELLECASLIISASEDTLYEPVVEYRTGRVPFSELPVNQVMENWSWQVLNREMIWEDDFMPYVPKQALIEQCLECN
jgi:hypothetical protein